MKVVIDGFVFENTYQFGVRRVFTQVMARTAEEVNYTLWLQAPAAVPIPAGIRVIRGNARQVPGRFDVIGRLRARRNRRRRPTAIKVPQGVTEADVYHSTYFTPRPCPGPAVVVSVYDMVAELMFGCSGGGERAQNIADKRNAITSADVCLTISHATAADLIRFYPEVAAKVRVVHLGADHLLPGGPEPDRPPDPDRYILFVGDRNGYKNFQVMLDAMRCTRWPADTRLVVVGPPLARYEADLIRAVGLAERVEAKGRVADAELSRLYRRAGGFVYPSLLEGFGLPLLEAAVNGCPVVCSDTAVFREVSGPAALFFDPRLGESLADAVSQVFEPAVRDGLVEQGYENARRFTWADTAAAYRAVYAEAASMSRKGVCERGRTFSDIGGDTGATMRQE